MYPWFKPQNNKKNIKKNILERLERDKMTMGNHCIKLENQIKKILKVKYVVLTTSGTSALMMASIALGVKLNKKIICSDMNWVASVNPSKILGAKIYLVDAQHRSHLTKFAIMNNTIQIIKPHTVILTHLNGEPSYNEDFLRLKKKLKFKVIEDAAQAFFVKNTDKRFCGTSFDIGCFSLSITKLINMVYGGFCVTNSKEIVKRLRAIRNNGIDAEPENAKLQLSTIIGLNFKPSDMHASVGLSNLKLLRENVKNVKQIHDTYKNFLNNKRLDFLKKETHSSIPIYNCVFVRDRNKFIKFCENNEIGIHLGLRGLHEHVPYKKNHTRFKSSYFISKHLIRLPSGPGYSVREIKQVCKILNRFK